MTPELLAKFKIACSHSNALEPWHQGERHKRWGLTVEEADEFIANEIARLAVNGVIDATPNDIAAVLSEATYNTGRDGHDKWTELGEKALKGAKRDCPRCAEHGEDGVLERRYSRKTKQSFLSCSRYPVCKYSEADKLERGRKPRPAEPIAPPAAKAKPEESAPSPEPGHDEAATDVGTGCSGKTVKLLEEISTFLDSYIDFTPAQRDICAVWIMHTHVIEVFDFTPYLWIFSPVKRCGKTRLLFLLQMTKTPWMIARTTAAAVARMISAKHPTLLLDESDTHGDNGSLQNVLNAGFMRGQHISVCELNRDRKWEPVDYDVFGAKAIAGIGYLPDTVMDRSIPIQLQRAKAKKAKYRDSKVKPLIDEFRARLAAWEKLASPALKALDFDVIEVPPEIEDNDRHVDVALPLLAIADLAGGRWPKAIRNSLIEVWSPTVVREAASVRERLLADIREVFAENPGLRAIPTADLISNLLKNDESEWREHHHGKEITPHDLSRLLKPMKIEPKSVRIDADTVLRGYSVSDFSDAFEKYL